MDNTKIKDITKFCSCSQIKPELAHVYVKHNEFGITYVATDSFKLIEVTTDRAIHRTIKEGFYTPREWKMIVKAFSKKDIDMDTVTMLQSKKMPDDWSYPEYQQLYKGKELKPFDFTGTRFTIDHLVTFLKAIDHPHVSFNDLVTPNGQMVMHESNGVRMLLMKCAN